MQIEFEDSELRRVHEDPKFVLGNREKTKGIRKVFNFILAAADERDFYTMRSLNFEKLKGKRKGEYSLRTNDQWRLIIRLEMKDQGKTVIIVGFEDYH